MPRSAQALAALEILSRLLLQAPGMDADGPDSGVEAAMDHGA